MVCMVKVPFLAFFGPDMNTEMGVVIYMYLKHSPDYIYMCVYILLEISLICEFVQQDYYISLIFFSSFFLSELLFKTPPFNA